MKKYLNRLMFRNRSKGKVFYGGFTKFSKCPEKRERLVDFLTSEEKIDLPTSQHDPTINIFSSVNKVYQQQIRSFRTTEDIQQQGHAEKAANQNLAVALASAGLAIVGFIYPVANLFSLLGTFYINHIAFKGVYKSIVKHSKLNVDVLCILMLPMFVIQKYFFLMSLTSVIYASYHRILTDIKNSTTKKTIDIFKHQPRTVWVPLNDTVMEMPLTSLQSGDTVVVHPGEAIPVDGYIAKGTALIDQHLLTGEAQPVERQVGEPVFALTTVLAGRLHIKIEKAGAETAAAQIGHILNQTLELKTDSQLRMEGLTNKSVGATLLLSGFVYPLLGPLASLGVLYAHPKYRLLLPTTLNIFSYFNLAAQTGILIKDSRALETLNKVDTIVFDKTGTLTEEQPHIVQVYAATGYHADKVLAYAAAAEDKQTHPIARAILQEAQARQLDIPVADEVQYQIGYGLTVGIENQKVYVGSPRFIKETGGLIPMDVKQMQTRCYEQGHSLILVGIGNKVMGAIELLPTIRPEAYEVIASLGQHNSIYIISGDHEAPTRQLAQRLCIFNYFAETLPQHKSQLIEQLQQFGKTVCYIGDGINDSIALQQADVSISLKGASSAAVDTAQIILMDGTLTQLSHLFDLACRFEANLKTSTALVLGPSLFMLTGALAFHLSLSAIVVLGLGSFSAGMLSSLWPLLKNSITVTNPFRKSPN